MYSIYTEKRVYWQHKNANHEIMIISFVNQKGGSGKTTLALNISAAFSQSGVRVLLVDADPQATISDWAATREPPTPFQIIQMSKPVLHRDLPGMSKDYDHIIIDGPPRSYDVARSAISVSDIILVPVQPSGADFWATKEIVTLIKEASSFQETQKSALIVSRKISKTAIGRDMHQAISAFNMPILKASTTQRVAYAESMTTGKTIFEQDGARLATQEINAIKDEIMEMMK